MKAPLFSALAALAALALCQGCVFTAPCTFAWRSNTTQLVADRGAEIRRAADFNSVNADRQTDISATVPVSTTKSVSESVAEKCAEKAAEKTAAEDDCPDCRD